MKKILVIAAAVIAAGITQAATVQWKVAGSAASEGQTAYLVLTANIPETIESLDDITGAAFASGTITKSGRAYAAGGTLSLDAVDAGKSAGYTIFFVDNASNSYLNGGTGTVTGYGPTDPAVDPVASSPNYVAPGGEGWNKIGNTPIPEPTSVALIALGLAALGLKRKVA